MAESGKQAVDNGAAVPMDTNNNENKLPSSSPPKDTASRGEEKYGLRPRTLIKRLQQERTRQERQEVPKKQQRSKSRPAPLSKYRRKTANARERHRMREINNAFESLRKALPEAYETRVSNTMTKISTLKLAVQYIQALSRVLSEASDSNFYSLDSPPITEDEDKQHYEPQVTTSMGEDTSHSLSVVPSQQPCFFPSTVSLSSSSSSTPSFTAFSSSSSSRGSLSSASDLEEFLSDDSALLEDSLDVFHDIKPLPGPDPFELLLDEGKENLIFSSDFCTFK